MITDSHTHLDHPDFDTDQEGVVERALASGVGRIVTIGAADGFDSAERAITLTKKYPAVWAAVGIHPHDAAIQLDINRLKTLANNPKVVAIGETGLDFFKDWSPREAQYSWFRAQISLAIEIDKPIIIHSREAGAECLRILEEMGAGKVGGVFHCYSEDATFAEKLAKINFLVSFPGTLTFKKADPLREIAKQIPLEQIMVETDAPYMAPEPFRGKRCESSFVVETAKMLAKIKGLTLEEVAKKTSENAERLFRFN